jgi:hypothetical protein
LEGWVRKQVRNYYKKFSVDGGPLPSRESLDADEVHRTAKNMEASADITNSLEL